MPLSVERAEPESSGRRGEAENQMVPNKLNFLSLISAMNQNLPQSGNCHSANQSNDQISLKLKMVLSTNTEEDKLHSVRCCS